MSLSENLLVWKQGIKTVGFFFSSWHFVDSIDGASYSWLAGCDLCSKASALQQRVPCRKEYRNDPGCLKQRCSMHQAKKPGMMYRFIHVHSDVHTGACSPPQENHSWHTKHSTVWPDLLSSLAMKRTVSECVFTSRLQRCELHFTAARWRF